MRTPMKSVRAGVAVVMGLAVILALAATLRRTANAQGTDDVGSAISWLQLTIGSKANVIGDGVMSESGAYTVTSAGEDIWRDSDEFHYVYRMLSGDGQLVARVFAFDAADVLAKAGVMVRETLAPDSRNAMMLVTHGSGTDFQWRTAKGGTSQRAGGNTSAGAPYWVKIVRSGDWIGGYSSVDGSQWTLVSWVALERLPEQVYIGLAVASHQSGVACTAGFDRVMVGGVNPAEVLHPAIGAGDGLAAKFYPNRHLFGAPVVNRVTARVDFDFLSEVDSDARATNLMKFEERCMALIGVPDTEQFGVRWIGEVEAQFTEPYTFWVESDDCVRLWINEQLLIDRWNAHDAEETPSAVVELVAGQKYLLRLEYAQNRGQAVMRLKWSSPSTAKCAVPQSQLFSRPSDADRDGMPDLWEQAYGLNPNDAADAALDPDGDGLTNAQEFQRGASPTNPLHWGVPNEWWHGDIEEWGGSRGDARFSRGRFTMRSDGAGIGSGMDSFQFLYQPLDGNGEIVARVVEMKDGDLMAKAGVMIRETLAPDSRNAMLVTRTNGEFFQWRSVRSAQTDQTEESTNTVIPHWIKVVRCGDWLGGYGSTDGTDWKLVGWTAMPRLSQRVFVGLAVTGNDTNAAPCEAVFDEVSVRHGNPAEMMQVVVGSGDGLMGSYYDNGNLSGLPVTNRVDSEIDFGWGERGPVPGVGPDRFGIVWSGELEAQFTELYTLKTVSDDGIRLWLNEQLLLDTLAGGGARRASTNVSLVAGQRYLLRLEYNDDYAHAYVRLSWSSPSTSLRVIPQSQLYSRMMDADGDGMPDLWEILHNLNKNDASDAAQDPDGDGLTNLQEYKYHTDPHKADSDDDGVPDDWEIQHGLNPRFDDAAEDADNDGLNNLREFQLQTNPYGWDSDGDGLPDLIEAEYLGTNPNVANNGLLSVAAAVNGTDGNILLGEWQAEGTALCGMDRRGEVEFTLTTTNADKFLLKIEGGQRRPRSLRDQFNLLLSVDGESLGHHTLTGSYGTNGAIECLTPYLKAGLHKVRVFWDDTASFSSLRIERLTLLSVSGGDTNFNGVKDWVEKAVRTESGFDADTALTSIESPVCVEGRDLYRSMMDLKAGRVGEMTNVVTRRNAGMRWFANVPLLSGEPTRVRAEFQNSALAEVARIKWNPVNVMVASNLVIRKGSSLLLTAQPTNASGGRMVITIGPNQLSGPAAQPQAFEFSQAGVYTVTGTFTPLSGPPQSRSISVTVIGHRFSDDPACWVGQGREWRVPSVTPGVVIEVDPRIQSGQEDNRTGGGKILSLVANINEPRYVVSRLGAGGPILDSARVNSFRFSGARDTYMQVVESYDDGSKLVEMLLIQSPVVPDVTVRLKVIVGGVMFEDGTTDKELSAADFDALGICRIRFIRAQPSRTSVCHSISVFQGSQLVGRIQ